MCTHIISSYASIATLVLLLSFTTVPALGTDNGADAEQLLSYQIVLPESTKQDNYILTQKFIAAFAPEDTDEIKHFIAQGMLGYPEKFPKIMELVLILAKQPDSRLFLLLEPLSKYLTYPESALNIDEMVRTMEVITGVQPPVDQSPDPLPAIEEFRFVKPLVNQTGDNSRATLQDSLLWIYRLESGSFREISITASLLAGTDSVFGKIHTETDSWSNHSKTDNYILIENGIINFILPRGLSENDFYADAKPQLYLEDNPVNSSSLFSSIPCTMQIHITPEGEEIPPNLTLTFEQNNATFGQTDFLCRAQCLLGYTWTEGEYKFTSKHCYGENWGVWPFSMEKLQEITNTPLKKLYNY